MKLAITQFLSLDGVSQGPGAPEEDTSGGFTRGGWLVPHIDPRFVEQTSQWLKQADGLLFGRRTYQAFARDWPRITDPNDPYAARMNTLPKFVVSNTLESGDWHPTTVLPGDLVDAVGPIKQRPGGELQVHGSARLGASLLAAGLVDIVRLVVAPTVVGAGRRLLEHPLDSLGFRLTRQETTEHGLLIVEYDVTGAAQVAHYEGVVEFV